ncbi:MAG TPA: hypothetical protein VFA43_07445 [Gemmatimonadaceae bacterium]|nr:hypothetical protein [Gemmatimonadaceae bacterium]
MTIKLLGLAAAIAVCPAVLLAQQTSPKSSSKATATTTSAGEVSENVPQKAIEEQKDPNLVGSPAWWTTHATADGKPLSAEGSRAEKKKSP